LVIFVIYRPGLKLLRGSEKCGREKRKKSRRENLDTPHYFRRPLTVRT
jgi:hypothetical protein